MKTILLTLLLSAITCAQSVDQLLPPALAPALAHWRAAVLAGDADALKGFYAPAAQIQDPTKQPIALPEEIRFWISQKKSGLATVTLDIVKVEPPQNGIQYVKFQAELKSKTEQGTRTSYVVAVQGWQAGSSPRIASEMRTGALRLKQPVRLNPRLYDPAADARAEIRQAEQRAGREHKRVLLVFGGNWCYDCHVLDMAFHSGDVEPTLDRSYIVVHVDVGEYDKNLDLAEKYQIPLKKGVPAIAVVDASDQLVFSQQAGEFEKARSLAPEQVIAFLQKWKPASHPR